MVIMAVGAAVARLLQFTSAAMAAMVAVGVTATEDLPLQFTFLVEMESVGAVVATEELTEVD